MTVDVSKTNAYVLTGASAAVEVAKVNVYVLMEVGTEAGATANVNQGYSYAQVIEPET